MSKKQYIQVTLISGRTYLGYVNEFFNPTVFEEDIFFTLYNVHFLFPKTNSKKGASLMLVGLDDSPEGLIAQMDIMWHAVASIQYLREDSPLVEQMEKREKAEQRKTPRKKAELVILKRENKQKP